MWFDHLKSASGDDKWNIGVGIENVTQNLILGADLTHFTHGERPHANLVLLFLAQLFGHVVGEEQRGEPDDKSHNDNYHPIAE